MDTSKCFPLHRHIYVFHPYFNMLQSLFALHYYRLPAPMFSDPFHLPFANAADNLIFTSHQLSASTIRAFSISIYTPRHSSGARSLPRAPATPLYSLLAFISPYSSISAILSHACPSPYGFAACDIFSYSSWLSRSFVNSL